MDSKGHMMTQNADFSLITHTKQLLLVTFCDTTAEIGASFRTQGQTDGRRIDKRKTNRHGSPNSYLDYLPFLVSIVI